MTKFKVIDDTVKEKILEEEKSSNNTVKLVTRQGKIVKDILDKGQTYKCTSFRKDFDNSYKALAKYFNMGNDCPIFCLPLEKENKFIEDGVSGSKGMDTSDGNDVRLVLDVPLSEIHTMEYYDWSDFIYYTHYEDDKILNMTMKQSLEHPELYLGDVDKPVDSYDYPQVIISEIRPEWVVNKGIESLNEEVLNDGHAVTFESPYQVKDYLLSTWLTRPMRIFIDKKIGLYILGEANDTTHQVMVNNARKFGGYDTRFDDYDKDKICLIFCKKEYMNKWFNDDYITCDDYDTEYDYGDFKVFSRYQDFTNFELCNVLGKYTKNKLVENSLHEGYLTEANRQQLLNKSRNAQHYKDTSKGKNRFERRTKSKISATVRDYNKIDMDGLFKRDILFVTIPVIGETDVYGVDIQVNGVLAEVQRQVVANKGKLEFKVILQSLMKVLNTGDVYINCECPDFKYRHGYWATKNGYKAKFREPRAPKTREQGGAISPNVADTMGAGCKHIMLVLANLDWAFKVASVINNYIKWCQQNMQRNYADYIFPKVYGVRYNNAVRLNLFDTGLLPNDQKTMSDVINVGMKGKDSKGRFVKDNPYKFQRKPSTLKVDGAEEEEDTQEEENTDGINVR